MSSFLEFNQQAYRIPFDAPLAKWTEAAEKYGLANQGIGGWGDRHVYFVFVEGGDNNVIDHDGRVARKWLVAAAGTWYEAFRHICHIAADYVHGGMVCFRTRAHWTKPENYIAKYREIMESAQEMDVLLGRGSFTFQLSRLPEQMHPWQKELEDKGRLTKGEQDKYTLTISPLSDEAIADFCWLATACTHKGEPLFWMTSNPFIM